MPDPEFRTDLFRGTAQYYDRYRLPYPAALFDDLRARVPLSGDGWLLDLGCGTGQITFPLADDVAGVWAVDQEPEAAAFVAAKANRLGLRHVQALAAPAETIDFPVGFTLIACGNAFHRMRRSAVAERAYELLAPGGCVALLWGGTPWRGGRAWQAAVDDVFTRWMTRLDVHDRVPAGWERAIEEDPHEQVLRRAGFVYEGSFDFVVTHTWSVEDLIGFAYSTSFLGRSVVGALAADFEEDMRATLQGVEPSGAFTDEYRFSYDLFRKGSSTVT
jgi:SAM-dependent methyltransferase